MTIIEALKNNSDDIRLVYGRKRYLIWRGGQWVVFERNPKRPYGVRPVIVTTSEQDAVAMLIEDEVKNGS